MANAPIGMILTAGLGTRLYPLNLFRPKPMMELFGKPILYFLIRMLERASVKDVILNLHYYPQQISKILNNYQFKARIHLVYEKNILGTAGGVANAMRIFNIENRPLIVMHGDILCDINLEHFINKNDFCTLLCDEDREISGYQGSVGIDNKGQINELGRYYQTKVLSTRRGFFTGIQFLSPLAVELIKTCQQQSLIAEVYPQWLREGRPIKGIVKPLLYEDLGSKERLFNANMAILRGQSRFRFMEINSEYKEAASSLYIGEGAMIDKTAKLVPPVLIGHHVCIDRYACIGPQAIIGDHCMIGAGAKIQNSLIMSQTRIEKDEYLDCRIGLNSVRVLMKAT